MDLAPFNYSLGISDILAYGDCPARFALGMERWSEEGELPGQTNESNAYGSAIHLAIHLVDTDGISHAEAIERAMAEYGAWLQPSDVTLLHDDLLIFEKRRPLGVTLVAAEADLRVPLFIADGQQIYFRFKVDVLHRLIANPAVFLSRDYKSSKWPKGHQEVHSDPQQWAYNWAIHEYYPECRTLLQTYDQLKYGAIPTSKNDEQRAEMKQWLIARVKVILSDQSFKPRRNQWCRWCSEVVTCSETRRSTAAWKGQLAVLAPLTKEGRKIKVAFRDEGEALEKVVRDDLPEMLEVRKHIEKVEEELKTVIKMMPEEERKQLGWALRPKTTTHLDPQGLKALHDLIGDAFYELVSLPMTVIERNFGKPKKDEPVSEELQLVRQWLLSESQPPTVVAVAP